MHATKLWFKTCLNVGINNKIKKKTKTPLLHYNNHKKDIFTKFNFNINDFFKKNFIERKPNNIKSRDTQSTLYHTILHILMLFVLIQTRKRRNDCSYSTQNISMEIVNILTFYIIIWIENRVTIITCFACKPL